MRLLCENGKKYVNIGGSDIWKSVYSTVVSCLGEKKKQYSQAFDFLEVGMCKSGQGYIVARQINHIRDELSQFSPERAVYDIDDPSIKAPWDGKLSPVVTSCANLYTTADGQDLFFEIVSILCYAQVAETNVISE